MSNQEEVKELMASKVSEIIGTYDPEEDSIVVFVVKSEGEMNNLSAVTNVQPRHMSSTEIGYQRLVSDYILKLSQSDLYAALSVTEDVIDSRQNSQFRTIIENTDPETDELKDMLAGILISKMRSMKDNL